MCESVSILAALRPMQRARQQLEAGPWQPSNLSVMISSTSSARTLSFGSLPPQGTQSLGGSNGGMSSPSAAETQGRSVDAADKRGSVRRRTHTATWRWRVTFLNVGDVEVATALLTRPTAQHLRNQYVLRQMDVHDAVDLHRGSQRVGLTDRARVTVLHSHQPDTGQQRGQALMHGRSVVTVV